MFVVPALVRMSGEGTAGQFTPFDLIVVVLPVRDGAVFEGALRGSRSAAADSNRKRVRPTARARKRSDARCRAVRKRGKS